MALAAILRRIFGREVPPPFVLGEQFTVQARALVRTVGANPLVFEAGARSLTRDVQTRATTFTVEARP